MPRPSPEQRKRIEANKAKNAKIKASMDAHDAQMKKRVQGIITDAMEHLRSTMPVEHPDPAMQRLFDKLERAYALALSTLQPGHAVAAVMSEAKLRGFLVEQNLIVQGTPDQFRRFHGDTAELKAASLERIRESMGSKEAARLLLTMKREGYLKGDVTKDIAYLNGEVLDVEPTEDDENDSPSD